MKTADASHGGELAALAEVIVLAATDEELAEHEAMLDRLDIKEAKAPAVWRAVTQIDSAG